MRIRSMFSLHGAMYAAERQCTVGGKVGRVSFSSWNASRKNARGHIRGKKLPQTGVTTSNVGAMLAVMLCF